MPIDDPIAWWRLDDDAGTTPQDSSGNGFHGTFVGFPTWVAGQVGGALNLSGTDQAVDIPFGVCSAVAAGTEITIACWFKGSLFQSAVRLQPTSVLYVLLGFGNPPVAALQNDGEVVGGLSIPGVQDGEWHHVAMTWQANTVNGFKIYVDGAVASQRNSNNSTLPNFVNDFPAALGAYRGVAVDEETNGTLDDVRIFDRALSDAEVTELFQWRDLRPLRVGSDGGGSGHLRQKEPQRLPYWWQAALLQQIEETERQIEEYRRLRKIAEAEIAAQMAEEARFRAYVRSERRQRLAAQERMQRQANAAEVAKAVQVAREEAEAERAALWQRADDALGRVEARRQREQAAADAEELRGMRQIVRSGYRPFRQRFETAIELLRRQGWRAKD